MIEKPKNYIITKWEYRDGFKYKEPYDYCNGIKMTFETIRDFKKIFGVDFSIAKKESRLYNLTLKDCNYDSKLWKDEETKNKAFNKIYFFNKKGKSGSCSSTTPLFPFEIYLLNDDFEMINFCELNAINPGDRIYRKRKNIIYIAFGIEINNKKTNFYFRTTKSNLTFQVDNSVNNYNKAINGKLKPLELVFSKS